MIIKKGEGEGFVAEREDNLSHGSRSHGTESWDRM